MPAGSPTGATATTQADALAMLMAVNEHEIAAADQALGKNVTGAVRDFAQMMKTDHGKNLADTTKLGGAASTSPGVKTLKDKGDADLRTLDAQSGKAYEKAYIDAMVKGHTDALAMIDNTLLPAATDTNIRQHFTTTRAAVARHLDKAKEIQGTLKYPGCHRNLCFVAPVLPARHLCALRKTRYERRCAYSVSSRVCVRHRPSGVCPVMRARRMLRCACQPAETLSMPSRVASRLWTSNRRTCSPCLLSSMRTCEGGSLLPKVKPSTCGGSYAVTTHCIR
jgi:putative membrane protein